MEINEWGEDDVKKNLNALGSSCTLTSENWNDKKGGLNLKNTCKLIL